MWSVFLENKSFCVKKKSLLTKRMSSALFTYYFHFQLRYGPEKQNETKNKNMSHGCMHYYRMVGQSLFKTVDLTHLVHTCRVQWLCNVVIGRTRLWRCTTLAYISFDHVLHFSIRNARFSTLFSRGFLKSYPRFRQCRYGHLALTCRRIVHQKEIFQG